MKVVFLGNYFNHHQRFLSDALATRCDYHFITTRAYNEKRLALGWSPEVEPDYVCHYEREPEQAEALLESADVILTGSAPEKLVRRCIQRNQLVLRYAERPLKNGLEPLKYFPRLVKWHWQNPPGKRIRMLCASAYTAGDYALFGLFRGKCYCWGYFPELKQYESGEALLDRKKPATILWVGRFLHWKHPDDAVAVAARMKQAGFSFQMKIIGTGELEQPLRERVEAEGLSDCVTLPGSMKPEQVRACMEESELFLFTSDRREGWGVVLNEAMNSGCAVVANREIGSAPYLIRDGENGYLYRSGDVDALYGKVVQLLTGSERRQMGLRAYETILKSWNPEIAAQRLLCLAEGLLSGRTESPYADGPCSGA